MAKQGWSLLPRSLDFVPKALAFCRGHWGLGLAYPVPILGPACPGHQQSHQGWQARPEGQGSGMKGDRRPSSTVSGLS